MFNLSKEQILSVSVSSAHLLRLYDRFECLDRDNRGYLRSVDALLIIIIHPNNNYYVFWESLFVSPNNIPERNKPEDEFILFYPSASEQKYVILL